MGRSCARTGRRVAAAVPGQHLRIELEELRTALVSAGHEIAKLAESVGGDGAEILEFQVALLGDDDLLDPIFAAIDEEGVTSFYGLVVRRSEAQIGDWKPLPPTNTCRRAPRTWRTCAIAWPLQIAAGGGRRAAPRIPCSAVNNALKDLPPSRYLEIDWSGGGGLAQLRGSPNSHVARLARARGIPMVVYRRTSATRRCCIARRQGTPQTRPTQELRLGLFGLRQTCCARTGLRRVPFWRAQRHGQTN